MSTTELLPEIGQIVAVRQRLYLVDRVKSPPNPSDSILVQLSCVDDDAQGQRLDVLWERELDAEILTEEAWDSVCSRGFDPSDRFAAYLNTLRWNCVTSTDPNLFQSPFRAGIRLDQYQLEPLRKALLLPRVNLFIADDVGLGKTIEAGLIARELLMRKKVRDIVVSAPPSMLLQWKEELDARFGLRFEILDKDYIQRVRRERGFGVNPWTTHSRFLISQRLLIDESYASSLQDWLGTFRPGSLLILDEAHHAAPASGQRYAIDSHITRAVRDLAPRFEHRLFLSATPHNGHSNSFSALLELLDPQRFCRGVKTSKKMLNEVMVRRLKDDLRKVAGGFPERKVVQEDIDGLPENAPELRLTTLLDEYRRTRESRLRDESRRTQSASGLLICGLQQRLFSSIEAFSRTLRVHRKTVQRHRDAQLASEEAAAARTDLLTGTISPDDDRATMGEQELAAEEDAQVVAASKAGMGNVASAAGAELFAQEQKLLDEMTELAESSRAMLQVNSVELRTPPPASDDPTAASTGITGFQFPEWFITQGLEESNSSTVRTRLLVHRKALTKGKFVDRDRRKRSVVPVRFVRACRAGHINDIDWYVFVHNGKSDCAEQRRQLFIDERGTSGDLTEVWIRCECKAERSMAQAAIMANRALGVCDGSRIWLGSFTKEPCGEPNRLLIRSASNAYFPQVMSVISLPERDDAVRQAIDSIWSYVEAVETIEDLKYERKKAAVKAGLDGISDDEAFAEIQSRQLGATKIDKPVKVAELETLIAAKDEVGEEAAEWDFLCPSVAAQLLGRAMDAAD